MLERPDINAARPVGGGADAQFCATTAAALAGPGYACVAPQDLSAALAGVDARTAPDWEAFAASWDRLARDEHMGDGGRYRYRRHGVYAAAAFADPVAMPPAAHYQSRTYNALNGGIARWFEPLEPGIVHGATLGPLLGVCCRIFSHCRPQARWHIEVHQFRIVAGAGSAGKPTPEGVHRDGVDFVFVMMVRRHNIASGTTELYDGEGRRISSFTLVQPRAAVLLDDRRLAHGVTPVVAVRGEEPSYRDVLVVTFRDADARPA
jgi:hypothetical protein